MSSYVNRLSGTCASSVCCDTPRLRWVVGGHVVKRLHHCYARQPQGVREKMYAGSSGGRSPKGDHTSATYCGLLWKEMSVLYLVAMPGIGMRTARNELEGLIRQPCAVLSSMERHHGGGGRVRTEESDRVETFEKRSCRDEGGGGDDGHGGKCRKGEHKLEDGCGNGKTNTRVTEKARADDGNTVTHTQSAQRRPGGEDSHLGTVTATVARADHGVGEETKTVSEDAQSTSVRRRPIHGSFKSAGQINASGTITFLVLANITSVGHRQITPKGGAPCPALRHGRSTTPAEAACGGSREWSRGAGGTSSSETWLNVDTLWSSLLEQAFDLCYVTM
ncbi:hypothetical protein BJV78DRAFT_1154841 [Lactifluus subvellereus]|nr:hypothetical protein BJV78DRAFT_1154841 [Lactifluus subvellereus]